MTAFYRRKRPRKWTNSLVKVVCWAIAFLGESIRTHRRWWDGSHGMGGGGEGHDSFGAEIPGREKNTKKNAT